MHGGTAPLIRRQAADCGRSPYRAGWAWGESARAELYVARQTGTSVAMIEKHYGGATVRADDLDELIASRAAHSAESGRHSAVECHLSPRTLKKGNLGGTLLGRPRGRPEHIDEKSKAASGIRQRAGDRGRTGDVQLGKLAFYR